MTPFFVQKEVLGEKIIIWVKYGNIFTQIIMFSLQKVDDLWMREWEQEEKGTTDSAPKSAQICFIKRAPLQDFISGTLGWSMV